jgi:hypothetical protein
MGSENGRRFVPSRSRYASAEHREQERLLEEHAAAKKEKGAAASELKRFEIPIAEARLAGKEPPQAAREAQRAYAAAEERIAACETLLPERQRAVEAREAEWLDKQLPEINRRNQEELERVISAFRVAAEVLAGYEEHRADVTAAAPHHAPPALPNLRGPLELLFTTVATWPPKPRTPPPGTIRVRKLPDVKRLDPQHRLYNVVGEAFVQLALDRYGPGMTFGVPTRLAVCKGRGTEAKYDVIEEYRLDELLPYLGLERVADEGGGGAA